MPQFDFVSPGAAAGNAISQYMLQQEALRRQAMLDQITQQREARLAEKDAADIEVAKQNAARLASQTETENAARQQGIADAQRKQFVGSHLPGDTNISDTQAQANPDLVNRKDTSIATGVVAPGVLDITNQHQNTYQGDATQRLADQKKQAVQAIIAAHPEMSGRPEMQTALRLAQATGNYDEVLKGLTAKPQAPEHMSLDGAGYEKQPDGSWKLVAGSPKPTAEHQPQILYGMDGKAHAFTFENGVAKEIPLPDGIGKASPMLGGATTGNRVVSAQAVTETGKDIIDMLSDPQVQATLGPALGRYSSMLDFIGDPPPQFRKLAGMIESYSLANMGVHGMRANTGAEAIKSTFGLGRSTPDAMIATVQGLNGFANHLLTDTGHGAATTATPAATNAADASGNSTEDAAARKARIMKAHGL